MNAPIGPARATVGPMAPADPNYPALLGGLRQDLDEVEAAMTRLEEGTYGRCQGCGGPIEGGRLSGDPVGRYCSTCAPGPGLDGPSRDGAPT